MGKEAHRYEYSVELDSTDAPARVIRLVGRNKRVLDLGGGPGSITRFLHQPGGCRITMLYLDAEAMERGAR